MGEAKRRKQKLGLEYGQPLGLNSSKRRKLIEDNLLDLLSCHYQVCGYPDFVKSPKYPTLDSSSETNNSFDFLPSLIQHWQETFNSNYPRSSLSQAMKAILKNVPIFLTDASPQSLSVSEASTPIIPFPYARDYFRQIFSTQNFTVSQHCVLVSEVLEILAAEKFSSLLEQLLASEVSDLLNDAFDDREDWLVPYINKDGLIDLTEEVKYIAGNRAITGLLTLLLTLPWEIELKKL